MFWVKVFYSVEMCDKHYSKVVLLPGSIYSVFQNDWILVEILGGVMLGYLSVFPIVEFQLYFIQSTTQIKHK